MVLEGTSREQQLFIEDQVSSLIGEGGRPVLVLDGAAYPPKAVEVASRRAARDVAEKAARTAEEAQDGHKVTAEWKKAARPQEPFFAWLLQWCISKHVAFIVAPNEADEQLVALQEDAGGADVVVLAASQAREAQCGQQACLRGEGSIDWEFGTEGECVRDADVRAQARRADERQHVSGGLAVGGEPYHHSSRHV